MKNYSVPHIFYTIFLFFAFQILYAEEKRIVVVIPSYNNSKLYERNLISVLEQEYSNYHVLYIDDCSPDGTGNLVEEFIAYHNVGDRFTLVKNQVRCLAARNIYYAIHTYCQDDDIVVLLDGDDWFAQKRSLAIINEAYQDPEVWLTYGFYRTSCGPGWGFSIPHDVIKNNAYRTTMFNDFKCAYTVSHPRTFYAWLYKLIKMEDLQYQGEFMRATYDQAIMYPLLEMSGGRFKVLKDILYVYYVQGELHDFKVNREAQLFLDTYIHTMPPYTPLLKPIKKSLVQEAPFSCCLIMVSNFEKNKFIAELIKKHSFLKDISRILVCGAEYAPETIKIDGLTVKFVSVPEDINSFCKRSFESGEITEEYSLFATDELFAVHSLQIAAAVKLLRQTEGFVFSYVRYEPSEKHALKNTTFLQDNTFVFQLEFKPELFFAYKECAHLFLTKDIQESYRRGFSLFDTALRMQPQYDVFLVRRSGLMGIGI